MKVQEVIPNKDVIEGLISVLHLDPTKKYQSIKVEVSIDDCCRIETKTIATWP